MVLVCQRRNGFFISPTPPFQHRRHPAMNGCSCSPKRPLTEVEPGSYFAFHRNDWYRRVSPVVAHSGDRLLSEPIAGTQPCRREPFFMPLSRPSLRLAAGERGRLNGHNPTEAAIPNASKIQHSAIRRGTESRSYRFVHDRRSIAAARQPFQRGRSCGPKR
jgi:hypothetical protein